MFGTEKWSGPWTIRGTFGLRAGSLSVYPGSLWFNDVRAQNFPTYRFFKLAKKAK